MRRKSDQKRRRNEMRDERVDKKRENSTRTRDEKKR